MDWIRVGDADTFLDGEGARVEVAGHRLAVFRIEDEFYVIGDRCSHADASLAEGELFDYDVECPRHGSEFDVRTGRPGSLPATRPVPTYTVRVEHGVVMVGLEPGRGEP
jgi:3-phenylpropionate/trans-cinnamate dioxygenase ferredoxin subunit